jgi:hypothetical protein
VNAVRDPDRPVPEKHWRNPMLWLVIGLPLSAVVAGFITLWIAVRYADPVLPPDQPARASAPP